MFLNPKMTQARFQEQLQQPADCPRSLRPLLPGEQLHENTCDGIRLSENKKTKTELRNFQTSYNARFPSQLLLSLRQTMGAV